MGEEKPDRRLPGRLFVSSLALASYAEQNLDLLVGLLLLDIAATFQVTVGLASQIVTISRIASIVTGLAMGALSVRFRHKSLLLVGLLVLIIGMAGSMLAPNLTVLQVFYPLDGVGTVIISAMALALIGAFLPLERRPRAIGWLMVGSSLAWVIGSPLVGFIAGFGGWQAVLGWLMIPISIVGLVFVFVFVPSTPRKLSMPQGRGIYAQNFGKVFHNRSATACLVGVGFAAFLQSWAVYAMTFYRTSFSLPLGSASWIILGATSFFALGGVVGGRIVDKIGRKNLIISAVILRSVIIAAMVFIPILWIVVVIDFANTAFGGMSWNAFHSLNVEQIPESRGTMLSMAAMFSSLGAALGVAVGGTVLDLLGFQVLAPALAIAGITSAIIVLFFAIDPCRKA